MAFLSNLLSPCTGNLDKHELKALYHTPPPNVDYSTNPTVFGRILEGSIPCAPLQESPTALAFCDHRPAAPLHGLVIPKRYVKSIHTLSSTEEDLTMLLELEEMGLEVLKKMVPEAYESKDYRLCFHVPPFISVGHLHLHVLAPISEMKFPFTAKFWTGAIWCADVKDVLKLYWTEEELLEARHEKEQTLLN